MTAGGFKDLWRAKRFKEMGLTPLFDVAGEFTFRATHHLRTYRGNVEEPHEHIFRAKVLLGTSGTDEDGIAFDFLEFERILDEVKAEFHEKNLNEHQLFLEFNPTAEYLATAIAQLVKNQLPENPKVHSIQVELWEKENFSVIITFLP